MAMQWTAEQIPDQSGRLAIITGANSGLGRLAALELTRHGADVILAVRDTGKGAGVAEGIARETGTVTPRVRALDLGSLESIRRFCAEWAGEQVDLLINNAGVMMTPHRNTMDGFELQFGTNHLGHFALTGQLLQAIDRSDSGRIVTVGSNEHKGGEIYFDDLRMVKRYSPRDAYQRSKLANTVFAFELDRRLRAAASSAISVLAHPGYAATNLQRTGPTGPVKAVLAVTNRFVAQRPERGVLPILYAATAHGVVGGEYYGPNGIAEMRGYPTRVCAAAGAYDAELGERLWQVSEKLTSVHYLVT